MDSIDFILTRRSIRNYQNIEISRDLILELIKAAVSAPSAGNQQPWHFIVIDNKKILEKIPDFHPNAKMLKNANKAILVCGDLEKEKYKGYWVLDCSAATQNILLAANTKGLGSCWLGVYPREDRIKNIKKMLNIPEKIIPFSIISLGFSDEKGKKLNREVKERVHYNYW